MAQQMYDRSNEVRRPLGSHNVGDPTATDASGDTGEGNVKWHTPRRYLVNAARFIVSREGTLLLKAKGATLSEVRTDAALSRATVIRLNIDAGTCRIGKQGR